MRREDPPDSSDRKNAIITRQMISTMRADPGAWYLLREYPSGNRYQTVKKPLDIKIRWALVNGISCLYGMAVEKVSSQ